MKITEQELINNRKKIVGKLRDHRKGKTKLTQKDVADKMEVTRGYVNQIESGDFNFSIDIMYKYCKAIGYKAGMKVIPIIVAVLLASCQSHEPQIVKYTVRPEMDSIYSVKKNYQGKAADEGFKRNQQNFDRTFSKSEAYWYKFLGCMHMHKYDKAFADSVVYRKLCDSAHVYNDSLNFYYNQKYKP